MSFSSSSASNVDDDDTPNFKGSEHWGVQLWDQFALVELHTARGLNNLNDTIAFVYKRAELEESYGNTLISTTGTWNGQGCFGMGRLGIVDSTGTEGDLWKAMDNETHALGEEHIALANQLREEIVAPLRQEHAQLIVDRQQLIAEARSAQRETENTAGSSRVDSACAAYHNACASAQAAQQKARIDTAGDDEAMSKATKEAIKATEKARQAKAAYEQVLEESNETKDEFFSSTFPDAVAKLQALERRRLAVMKKYVSAFTKIEESADSKFKSHHRKLAKASDNTSFKADSKAFIAENKSGQKRQLHEFQEYAWMYGTSIDQFPQPPEEEQETDTAEGTGAGSENDTSRSSTPSRRTRTASVSRGSASKGSRASRGSRVEELKDDGGADDASDASSVSSAASSSSSGDFDGVSPASGGKKKRKGSSARKIKPAATAVVAVGAAGRKGSTARKKR